MLKFETNFKYCIEKINIENSIVFSCNKFHFLTNNSKITKFTSSKDDKVYYYNIILDIKFQKVKLKK